MNARHDRKSPGIPPTRLARWAKRWVLGSCLVGLPAQAADDRFAVKVSGQVFEVNKTQMVSIRLTADAPWHMNMEYPTSMKLTGPSGLELKKTKFRKGDASVLSEHKILFQVPVRASSPGAFEAEATLKFAICKADACSPASTKVKLRLNARAPVAKPKAPPQPPEPKSKPTPRQTTPKKSPRRSNRKAAAKNNAKGPEATPLRCGLFAADQQCPAIPVYLVNQWMLDPVWGTGLMERVLTHLRRPPTTP